MPGKIGHLRPLCICYMGVDFRFFGLNGFHPDTVGHGGFPMFFIVFAFAMIWRYHWSSLHFFPVWRASPALFLSISMRICGALQSPADQLAQVDDVGNAWVAGSTDGSLDGNTNAGVADIFLMKFDAQGVHLWTRQHGGRSSDLAQALQADWGATSFSNLSTEEKRAKPLDPLARSMFRVRWNGITFKRTNLLGALTRSISHISRISRSISWKFERLQYFRL